MVAVVLVVGWGCVLGKLEAIVRDPFLTRHERFSWRAPRPARPLADAFQRVEQDGLRMPGEGSPSLVGWVPTRMGALAWTSSRGTTRLMALPTRPPSFDINAPAPRYVPRPRASVVVRGTVLDAAPAKDGAALLVVGRDFARVDLVRAELTLRTVHLPRLAAGQPFCKDMALGPDGQGGFLVTSWAPGELVVTRLSEDGEILEDHSFPAPTPEYVELYVWATAPDRASVDFMTDGGLIDHIMYFDPRTLDPVSPPFWERSRKVRDEMGTVWPIVLALLAAATLGACRSAWRRRTARPIPSVLARLQRRERDR